MSNACHVALEGKGTWHISGGQVSSLNHGCKIVIRKWDMVTCGMLSVKESMRCSTPREVFSTKTNLFGGMEEI